MARLGALAELDLDHPDLLEAGLGREPFGVEIAVRRPASEIAASQFPDQVAAMPLMVTQDHIFPRLEFLGTGAAGSDYLDAIVRRGQETPALRALADALASYGAALRLDHLPPDSTAARLLRP